MTAPVFILAIDPGYDRIGWAVGNKSKSDATVAYGLIQTQKQATIFERYRQLQTELTDVIRQHHPTELAIEQLYFSKNTTTALRVSEARGVVIATCLAYGLTVFEYNPSSIKLAVTGHGAADKAAVEKMVRLELKLTTTQLIDDTIDALALFLTHKYATTIA